MFFKEKHHLSVITGLGWFTSSNQHFVLRNDHLFEIPIHKDQFKKGIWGEFLQEFRDDFKGLSLGISDPGLILFPVKILYLFKFIIALGIILVRLPDIVCE